MDPNVKTKKKAYENLSHSLVKFYCTVSECSRDHEGISSGMNSSNQDGCHNKPDTRRKEFQKSAIS